MAILDAVSHLQERRGKRCKEKGKRRGYPGAGAGWVPRLPYGRGGGGKKEGGGMEADRVVPK